MDVMHNGRTAQFYQGYGHESEEFRQPRDPVRVDTHLQVAGPSRKRQRSQVIQDGPPRDRSSNWTKEETDVLFRCKKEALLAQGLSQSEGGTAAWETISEKIPGKSTVQCRRRLDTLKKSMGDIRAYCDKHHKIYFELQKSDIAEMRLATAYHPDWYQYIDEFCNDSSKRRESRNNSIRNVVRHEKEIHSSFVERGSHQQSLDSSMQNQELSLMPVTAPSEGVQESPPQGQEVMNYSFPGVSREWGTEVQLSMERQEELPLPPTNSTPSELCLPATCPYIEDRQEIVGFSFPRDSRACGTEKQTSLPICLVPRVCLQAREVTSLFSPLTQKDIHECYDTSPDCTKQILVDILLYSPWSMEVQCTSDYRMCRRYSFVSVKALSCWLAIVYGKDPVDIMYNLQDFHAKQRERRLPCKAVQAPGDSLADLETYLESAFHEARRTPERHINRLVVTEQHQGLGDICGDKAHHEATEVVHLFRCRHLTKLNLRSFTNLCSLCVEYCFELRDVGGWENLGNLGWLTWRHSCVVSFPDTRHLTSLQFLELDGDCEYTSTISSPPDLSYCHQLRSLTLKWYPLLVETPDLTNLKHLKALRINFCDNIRSLHSSLSALSGLVDADFSECHQLATLPDLRNLRNLQTLILSRTEICHIPGVEMLKELKRLGCAYSKLSFLPDLRDLAFLYLIDVRETGIIGRTFVLCHHDKNKQILVSHPKRAARDQQLQQLYSQFIRKGRNEVKGGVLSPEDCLNNLSCYENFASEEAQRRPGWTGSRLVIRGERRLQRAFEPDAQHEGLKVLVFIGCKYLTNINLEGLTNLRYLCIDTCNDVQEVSGWAKLKNLAVFRWRGAGYWNPSLLNTKHLTSLQHLHIHVDDDDSREIPARGRHWSTLSSRRLFPIDCIHLTSLSLLVFIDPVIEESPDLTQLKHLQRLSIWGYIRKIHSSLSELTALRHLRIGHSELIGDKRGVPPDLPSLSKLSKLQVLDLNRAAVESIPGVEKLANLRKLDCYWCHRIASSPDLSHLAFLEEIDVRWTQIRDKASVLCNHNQVKVRGDWKD